MDDVLSIIKEDNLTEFFEHINSLHEKIKFTIEKEVDGCIAFLDILIKRNNDGSLSTLVYRKPTHTDQYLNFHSSHQESTKESVVSALLTRAENIVSDKQDLERENDRIMNVLQSNDYSQHTISKVKQKLKRKSRSPNNNEPVDEHVGFINLPYIAGTSETLRRIFAKHKIRSTFYSSETLRKKLSHPKEKETSSLKKNIDF